MNNDYYSGAPASPARKKSSLNQPNIISVSLRFALLAVLGFLGWKVWSGKDFGMLGTREYVLLALIALPAAAIIIQMVVWALRWTKDERVSELGLHIVRFAVILFAVMMGVFVMLSIDYTNQYRNNISRDLTQQALAGRIYVQHEIGARLDFNAKTTGELKSALGEMMVSDSDVTRSRAAVLYLFADGREIDSDQLSGGFVFMDEARTVAAVSTSSSMAPMGGTEEEIALLSRVRSDGRVEFLTHTSGETTVLSALSAVYTTDGRPVGVLEIRQNNNDLLNVFSFASLDLFLRMAAFICLFSFGFYGVMQLVDIALRPRNFDKSRSVLSCGREAARPILFFVTLAAALPLAMMVFSSGLRDAVNIPKLPEGLDDIAPAAVYAAGLCLGYLLARHTGPRLTEMPSNLALGVTALCHIGLILLLDRQLIPALRPFSDNYIVILAVIALTGLCYGISFSTIKKYQKQSDTLFVYDKYAYLCSCLGAITGAILGAIIMDSRGDFTVRVVAAVISAVTCVMSVILLEDLNTTPAPDYTRTGMSGTSPMLLPAALPFAAVLGFVWIYISEFLRSKGYSSASAIFCAVMPVIAFCFGNRLRLRSTGTRRAAALVGVLLAAAAYVPLLISHSPAMAAVSSLVASFAVIFGSAALYSALRKEERSRFMGLYIPFLLIALGVFSMLFLRFERSLSLYPLAYTAAGSAALGVICLLLSVFSAIGSRGAAKASGAAAPRPVRKKEPAPKPARPAKEKTPKAEKPAKPARPAKEKTPKAEKPAKAKKTGAESSGSVEVGGTSYPMPAPIDDQPIIAPSPPSSSPVFTMPEDDYSASTAMPADDDYDSIPIVLPE